MKRNISLYIAGQKVDLDDDSLILFNYTMTDLTNPTIVKNSYSHQVKLKGTKTNNKLFGEIFRLDRETLYSEDYTGTYFDPMRKTPFEIFNDTSECLESGYCKLNSISRSGADISYSITLYGGLGAFLYGLSFNEDGTDRTLYDLDYYMGQNVPVTFELRDCKDKGDVYVKEAWECLANGGVGDRRWRVINFAVAYNGFPQDFDANKGLRSWSKSHMITLLPTDAVGGPKEGQNYVLVNFTNSHTEAEVCDYRWYLQRPIVSLYQIIDAIRDKRNNGGYTVNLDSSFFVPFYNPYYDKLWVTLPLISAEDRKNPECLINALKATKSPADYLLSFVKACGLVMTCDNRKKQVDIMRRDTFYTKWNYDSRKGMTDIDMSSRVNEREQEIVPILAVSRIYQMGADKVEGEFTEDYKRDFGVEYGIQKINTGYEFDNGINNLTETVLFKGAADVQERSLMFADYQSTAGVKLFALQAFEALEAELWDDEGKMNKYPMRLPKYNVTYWDANKPYYDLFPKIQLHRKDNSPIDGDGVLLFYSGNQENPPIYLSKDVDEFDVLNGGKPCWIMGFMGIQPNSVPMFRRTMDTDGVVKESADWGVPLAVGVSDRIYDSDSDSLYKSFWKGYLMDMFSANTKVLKCKVDLSGLQVNQTLLSRFFWYKGARWVLNKISNYSLTSSELTDCEFIKVNNSDSYTLSQKRY